MKTDPEPSVPKPSNYHGRILFFDCSDKLKRMIAETIEKFKGFDTCQSPAMPYIAAWREDDSDMWYEFVGKNLTALLDCPAHEAARVLRDSVLERRIYKNFDFEEGVRKESIDGTQLEDLRSGLRKEGRNTGRVEAVYRLMLNNGALVWLKDVANLKSFPREKINLSLGFLTVVSKEMELEKKCEMLVKELRNALSRIKTLNGLLPMCANCKKIRDDKGYWNQVDDYLRRHSRAEFSHGLCPECAKDLYPDFFENGSDEGDDMARIRDTILDIDNFLKNH